MANPDENQEKVELVFTVEPDLGSGAFVAFWDDPAGGGITTQGATLPELVQAVKEAVICHFTDEAAPRRARLHFSDAELQLT